MPKKKSAQTPAAAPEADLLGDMMAAATKVEQTPKKGKAKDFTLTLDDDDGALLDIYAASDAVSKLVDANQGVAESQLKSKIRTLFIEECISRGAVADNPRVLSSASKANFQVKHLPGLKKTVDEVKQQLSDAGYESAWPEIEKAITVTTTVGVRPFTDLRSEKATADEKAVGNKIMGLLKANLTPEELKLVLTSETNTTVANTWKEIAVFAALKLSNSNQGEAVDILDALFQIIPPSFFLSHAAFTGDLSTASPIIGRILAPQEDKTETFTSPDELYEAVVEGKEVTLLLISGGRRKKIGTKKCDNHGHAVNSAKKWFRDPAELNRQIAAFQGG